ncbi:redoxin domain-containing protein, partial [Aliarcobacter butzleri]
PVATVVAQDISDITIGGHDGTAQVIVVGPSLDTGVCATETRRFNSEAAKIVNAEVIVVSMNLPFGIKRFITTESIEN